MSVLWLRREGMLRVIVESVGLLVQETGLQFVAGFAFCFFSWN
jgi:hypothetical protein